MVFQNYALYPQKTVYKNLAFPLQMRKLPKEEIDKQGAAKPPRCSTSRTCSSASRANSRAASSSASRSAAPWCATRGVPDGRAALEPRRQAARADAHRDQALPPGPRGHHHLRDPRPARSGHHGRQDGGDEWRLPAAIRHPGAVSSPTRSTCSCASFVGSPGDEPDPARSAGSRGADVVLKSAEGWELPLVARQCGQGADGEHQQGGAGRPALDHQGASRRRSPARCRRKVYTVEPTGDVTFVQVFLDGSVLNVSVPPNRRWLEARRDGVPRVRPGQDAPLRRRDHQRRSRRGEACGISGESHLTQGRRSLGSGLGITLIQAGGRSSRAAGGTVPVRGENEGIGGGAAPVTMKIKRSRSSSARPDATSPPSRSSPTKASTASATAR